VQRPQTVNYTLFIKAVDEVFAATDLESKPTYKVPKPGELLQTLNVKVIAVEDEPVWEEILRRMALLIKTRGVVFRACFQDAERSNSTSLMCPRYSGKVTEAQFRQYFPFTESFTGKEMDLVVNHYSTDTEDVNFLALEQDLLLVVVEPSRQEPSPWLDRSSLSGSRRSNHKDMDLTDVDILDKVKSIVAERRLRLHGSFLDFDRLRRGVCSLGQVRTVFTILRIEIDSKEIEVLARIFADGKQQGMFNYRDFCSTVCLVPLNESWTHTTPAAQLNSREPTPRGHGGGRPRPQENDAAEAMLEEVELWISSKMQQRRIPMKSAFQDFDPVRTGRVTQTQFLRIMDMLRLELNRVQTRVLTQVYCDTGSREFAYLDFCKSVDLRSERDYFDHLPYYPERPASTYFSRKGLVTPLSPMPMLHTARPCTR